MVNLAARSCRHRAELGTEKVAHGVRRGRGAAATSPAAKHLARGGEDLVTRGDAVFALRVANESKSDSA
jgi:hypothetical protein